MNENRSLFALDGITGMLIATLLLLSILAGLTVWNIGVQSNNATNFYDIKNETAIGSGIMGENISVQSEHVVDVKLGSK
jgi:hypothetical protein